MRSTTPFPARGPVSGSRIGVPSATAIGSQDSPRPFSNAVTVQYAGLNVFSGTQTPEQGAAITIRPAALPDDGPTGQLFDDHGVVPWSSSGVFPPAREADSQPMLLAPSIASRMMSAWPAC